MAFVAMPVLGKLLDPIIGPAPPGLRTGNLWFAVGFHVAYDFMQLFVIGTPNGGEIPVGRLLDVSFNGPGVAHGRIAWHGGELARLSARRGRVPVHLVALPEEPELRAAVAPG